MLFLIRNWAYPTVSILSNAMHSQPTNRKEQYVQRVTHDGISQMTPKMKQRLALCCHQFTKRQPLSTSLAHHLFTYGNLLGDFVCMCCHWLLLVTVFTRLDSCAVTASLCERANLSIFELVVFFFFHYLPFTVQLLNLEITSKACLRRCLMLLLSGENVCRRNN